jgi:hypothetical protein
MPSPSRLSLTAVALLFAIICLPPPDHPRLRPTLHVSGEEPHSGIVASVTSGNPALVTCIDDERLQFQVRGPPGGGGGMVAVMRLLFSVGSWGCCSRGAELM